MRFQTQIKPTTWKKNLTVFNYLCCLYTRSKVSDHVCPFQTCWLYMYHTEPLREWSFWTTGGGAVGGSPGCGRWVQIDRGRHLWAIVYYARVFMLKRGEIYLVPPLKGSRCFCSSPKSTNPMLLKNEKSLMYMLYQHFKRGCTASNTNFYLQNTKDRLTASLCNWFWYPNPC